MDRLWVMQRSPAHESVLATVMLQTSMVPAAFCTILEDERQVMAYLETHVDVFEAQLDMLRERQEYWVSIERAGRRPKIEDLLEMKGQLCRFADGVMDRRVAIWNRRQRLASWSFLVRRDQRARFLGEARRLAGECKERRLLMDCSGPWAPGGFAVAPPVGPMLIGRPA